MAFCRTLRGSTKLFCITSWVWAPEWSYHQMGGGTQWASIPHRKYFSHCHGWLIEGMPSLQLAKVAPFPKPRKQILQRHSFFWELRFGTLSAVDLRKKCQNGCWGISRESVWQKVIVRSCWPTSSELCRSCGRGGHFSASSLLVRWFILQDIFEMRKLKDCKRERMGRRLEKKTNRDQKKTNRDQEKNK